MERGDAEGTRASQEVGHLPLPVLLLAQLVAGCPFVPVMGQKDRRHARHNLPRTDYPQSRTEVQKLREEETVMR